MTLPGIADAPDRPADAGYRHAPAALGRRLRWRLSDWLSALRENIEAECEERRGFLWLAVAFVAGALAYFSLPGEPWLVALLAALAIVASVAWRGWQAGRSWRVAALAAAVLAGAGAGKIRVELLTAPTIEREMTATITGRVLDRESRAERRPRIVLDLLQVDRLAPAETPRRIRLTLSPRAELPALGSRISLRARLMPLPGPAVPGAYDPRRAAFFEAIGGSGFSLGAWTAVEDAGPSWRLLISRIRQAMVARILAVLPGEAGAVAAALIVGERSALSEETNESLRLSGLAHILSISGLHMMLISGAAFFIVRAALALSPAVALRRPIRKWAAVAALLVATVYLTLSGGGAATVRSYVMAAIIFAAILADRSAISMRNLALAAFVVVLLEPESVVEPGFQMSFAAVAALVAGWEAWQARRRMNLAEPDVLPGAWIWRAALKAVLGVALTTLIAGLATAPFGAYHFERVASYSLLGNLLASPLVSAIIMPACLASLVAMPFGLEALPLHAMGWGIARLLDVSDWVASLPGADIRAPSLTATSLLMITAGLLWLCLWQRRWRLAGAGVIALAFIASPLLVHHPDLLVAADGSAVAVRDAAGLLRVSGARAGSFVAEQIYQKESSGPLDAAEMTRGVACDAQACVLRGRDGVQVAHVLDPAAFAEDCRRAVVIVTSLKAPPGCGARLIVDRDVLPELGSQAITFDGVEPLTFSVKSELSRSRRPWQPAFAQ